MALPTIWWYSKIADFASKVIPIFATLVGFFAWAYNIVEVLIVGSFNAIHGKLASLDLSSFSSADFSTWQYIGVVNSIFPLSEAIGILGAYYTAWLVVILLRWIKSFIPTVAN